jgi:16S rRNA (adenine(1408)-N(1))-methyltransferase
MFVLLDSRGTMDTVLGRKTEEIGAAALRARIAPHQGVLVDLGTGSGRFAYEVARRRPDLFCMGVDAVSENLRAYSTKALRKPARGGVDNVMFIRAAIETLPDELDGVATHVTVNLPWGSLLRGIVHAESGVVGSLERVSAPGAAVELLLTYDLRYEPEMMDELGLPELTLEYLKQSLTPAYERHGIAVCHIDFLGNDAVRRLPLDWARRLTHARQRQFAHILARVREEGGRPAPDGAPPSLVLSLSR